MKLCSKCHQNPISRGKGSYCVLCRVQYDSTAYASNSVKKIESASSLKRRMLEWYRKLKHLKLCLSCGGGPFHFCQLDYDHVPGRGSKVMDVSKMVRLGYAREKIESEIAKCDLICKNCHSLRTFNRRFGIAIEKGMF